MLNKLLSLLNERDWNYTIINGEFQMILGNAERKFSFDDEKEIQNLIDDIEMW